MKTNKKNTKQGAVPALRFPKFKECGSWIYLRGNKVFKQISNKNHNSDLPILAISQEHGAVPRDLIDYKVIVSESGLENYKVVEVGDFIISLRSFQGGIEYSDYKGICSPAYVILRKRLDIENQFFKYYFKSHVFIQYLNKNLEGIRDGKMVSYKQFSEILLPIPSISDKREQQKIADCLSSIDALIKAAENKIDELKAHKKGLMQHLFPAEGKTVPEYRFPEFQDAGEWEQTTIGAICTISNGKSNVQDNVQNGKYPLFDRSEIIKTSNKFLFDCEAIIIPGEGRFIPKHYFGYFDLHQRAYALKDFTCHALFVYHYITAFSFILTQKAVKSTVLSLRMPILEAFPLLLPNNIQEQQKIADCLSSIDDLITAQANHLEALKIHKKGLMQQLFPNINDIEA